MRLVTSNKTAMNHSRLLLNPRAVSDIRRAKLASSKDIKLKVDRDAAEVSHKYSEIDLTLMKSRWTN